MLIRLEIKLFVDPGLIQGPESDLKTTMMDEGKATKHTHVQHLAATFQNWPAEVTAV